MKNYFGVAGKMTLLLLLLLVTMPLVSFSKSIVLRLNDAKHTLVYYKLSTPGPVMVLGKDGTLTVNGRVYLFKDIDYFYYTTEDYNGAAGTEDGLATDVVVIAEDGGITMKGRVEVLSADGKVVASASDGTTPSLNDLPAGMYLVTDGVTTIKVQKK